MEITHRFSRKFITIGKKTMKFSIYERNLSQYEYRRKKKVTNRQRSKFGIFQVKNWLIKQNKTK